MAEEKKEAPPLQRVLVVSAHPDDPEFGFGATVAKFARDGAEVFYCVVTDGSQGGEDPHVPDEELTATRYQEQRCAAAKLGVADITFLGFRDGYVEADVELRKAITADIRRRKPDLVLTHAPVRMLVTQGIGGFHPDHLAVGEATLRAVYPDARNPRAYRELLAEGLEPHKVREVWLPGFTRASVLPPVQVGSPLWAGTLTASHAALTVLNCVQLPGNRFLAACNVQVRYFRYEAPVVLSSIALYMILIAFCTPRPTTVEPLHVGLVGCPLVGFVPSASR